MASGGDELEWLALMDEALVEGDVVADHALLGEAVSGDSSTGSASSAAIFGGIPLSLARRAAMSRLSPGISVPRTPRVGRLLSRTGWIRHRCRGGSRWRSDAGALGRLVLGDGDDRRTLAHLPVQLAEGSVERPVAGRHDRHVEALRVDRPDQRVITHDIGPPPLDAE